MKSRSPEFLVLPDLNRTGNVSEDYSLSNGTGLSRRSIAASLKKLQKMGLVGTITTSRGLKTQGLTSRGYHYFEQMSGGGV